MSERHLWRQTGRQRAEILHRDVSKEKEGMKKKRKSRDLSNRSLKTDREREREKGEPTQG